MKNTFRKASVVVPVLTHKGLATISAIDCGLCPKTDEGWDTDAFDKFWDKYQADLAEYRKSLPNRVRKSFDKKSY